MTVASVFDSRRVPSRALLRTTVQVVLTALAVCAAGLLVVPRLLGWEGVIVLSGSMEPTLEVGGVAFVDRVPPDRIRRGELLTFMPADSRHQVTHRVVDVWATPDGPNFRTQGDANGHPDHWVVTPRQVIGKVRLALPHLGGLAVLLVNRHLLGLAMAAAASILVGDDLRRWHGRRTRRRLGVVRPA